MRFQSKQQRKDLAQALVQLANVAEGEVANQTLDQQIVLGIAQDILTGSNRVPWTALLEVDGDTGGALAWMLINIMRGDAQQAINTIQQAATPVVKVQAVRQPEVAGPPIPNGQRTSELPPQVVPG